MNKRRRKKNT